MTEDTSMTPKNVERSYVNFLAGRVTPDELLDEIVAALHSTAAPDFDLIAAVGVGQLEALLLHRHEEALWPRIEELARSDARFRRALRSAWAFDSPSSEQRNTLLEELGEFRPVTLRFVLEPRTFDDADGFGWRAYEVEGIAERPHLADILRSIADRLDRPEPDEPEEAPNVPDGAQGSSRDS